MITGEESMHRRDEKFIHNYGLKPRRKELLRRTRGRWENDIRIDLREIGWEVEDWIHLAEDRDQQKTLVHTEMNPRVP
jgi:hypothetical protein